jgi:circadian clock protein KaiC
MAHSNQIREFLLTSRGVRLSDVYLGPSGVLTGSARVAREAEDRREEALKRREARERSISLNASLAAVDAKLAALQAERRSYVSELSIVAEDEAARRKIQLSDREDMKLRRGLLVNGPVEEQRSNGRKDDL